jgi:hypothetical protein
MSIFCSECFFKGFCLMCMEHQRSHSYSCCQIKAGHQRYTKSFIRDFILEWTLDLPGSDSGESNKSSLRPEVKSLRVLQASAAISAIRIGPSSAATSAPCRRRALSLALHIKPHPITQTSKAPRIFQIRKKCYLWVIHT